MGEAAYALPTAWVDPTHLKKGPKEGQHKQHSRTAQDVLASKGQATASQPCSWISCAGLTRRKLPFCVVLLAATPWQELGSSGAHPSSQQSLLCTIGAVLKTRPGHFGRGWYQTGSQPSLLQGPGLGPPGLELLVLGLPREPVVEGKARPQHRPEVQQDELATDCCVTSIASTWGSWGLSGDVVVNGTFHCVACRTPLFQRPPTLAPSCS